MACILPRSVEGSARGSWTAGAFDLGAEAIGGEDCRADWMGRIGDCCRGGVFPFGGVGV